MPEVSLSQACDHDFSQESRLSGPLQVTGAASSSHAGLARSNEHACHLHGFNEKDVLHSTHQEEQQERESGGDEEEEEEEEEDIDNLIEELESQDGDNADYEEEEAQLPGGVRLVPETLLQTDTRIGLTSGEVFLRRKQFGYNQMKGTWGQHATCPFSLADQLTMCRGEGEPHCKVSHVLRGPNSVRHGIGCDPRCRAPGLGRLWRHLCTTTAECMCRLHTRIPSWLHRRGTKEDTGAQGYRSS